MKTIKPEIKDIDGMTVAFIKVRGSFTQIPSTFGKLYTWISAEGYQPIGPAMAVYYTIPKQVPEDELEWELRSQLSGDVPEIPTNSEGLGVKHLDSSHVVSVMHKGPYEALEEVYYSLGEWIEEKKYQMVGPPEELYYNSPEEVSESELLTEIRFPVASLE